MAEEELSEGMQRLQRIKNFTQLTDEQLQYVDQFIDELVEKVSSLSYFAFNEKNPKEAFLEEVRKGDPVATYGQAPYAHLNRSGFDLHIGLSTYMGFHLEVESRPFHVPHEMLIEIAKKHDVDAYIPNITYDDWEPGMTPIPPMYFAHDLIEMFREDGSRLTVDELIEQHMQPVSAAINDLNARIYNVRTDEGITPNVRARYQQEL